MHSQARSTTALVRPETELTNRTSFSVRLGRSFSLSKPFDVLTQLTGFKLTRGMLCAMRRPALPSVEEVCSGARRIAVLENVMNPTNIGAIFRSAAALNMDAVLLTPACSNPLYRRAIRVSMGTVFQVPWTFLGDESSPWPEDGMQQLKKLGVTDVFTPGKADFSPLFLLEDGGYVGQVQHATRVSIDEQGVTAAAFTVIDRCGAGMPPTEQIDMTFDRPFVFYIESRDGLPLFTGIVNEP